MSRRDEVLEGLVLQGERVASPGKFEGEMAYVPYFWEKGLDGWADAEADNGDFIFVVMPEDYAEFPELRGKKGVRLHEDEQGFVREVPVDNPVETY